MEVTDAGLRAGGFLLAALLLSSFSCICLIVYFLKCTLPPSPILFMLLQAVVPLSNEAEREVIKVPKKHRLLDLNTMTGNIGLSL